MSYYTLQEELSKMHYAIPKALIQEQRYKEMTRDAKFLYSLLLDRYTLSDKNSKEGNGNWLDNEGRIYFVYEQESLSDLFGASEKTLRKYINELIKFELLEVKRMGLGMANRYYLKRPIIKDMLEKYKNKKAPTVSDAVEAPKDNSSDNSICNNEQTYTSDTIKIIKENRFRIKKQDLPICEKEFTDINKLEEAIKICNSTNSFGLDSLRYAYNSKNRDKNTNTKKKSIKGAGGDFGSDRQTQNAESMARKDTEEKAKKIGGYDDLGIKRPDFTSKEMKNTPAVKEFKFV